MNYDYVDEYDGTPADWDAEFNYDPQTGSVYGATKWSTTYFANQMEKDKEEVRTNE